MLSTLATALFAFFTVGTEFHHAPGKSFTLARTQESIPQSTSRRTSPFHHHPATPLDFQWSASLDSETGLATSFEKSNLPSLRSKNDSDDIKPKQQRNQIRLSDLQNVAHDMFRTYPTWLCGRGVSFGLICATDAKGGGVSIKDRFFGMDLLTFGSIRRKKYVKGSTSLQGTYEYPITGGFLAIAPKPENGIIQFSLSVETADNSIITATRMESSISEFRPSIAGPAPVSPVRKWAYLSTQRLVHAYVMRRFHGQCNAMILNGDVHF